ncbi:MAG: hypothetical protein WCL39_00585 [Armatimonadota bacterium]
MKNRAVLITLSLLIVLMAAGCKSKPASRWYKASYGDTWNAVLAAVKVTTGEEADSADKERGKIVTEWEAGSLAARRDDPTTARQSIDVWRGIINVEKDIAATKVVVRMEKGNYKAQNGTASNTNPDASGIIVLMANDKDPQQQFLSEVSNQLTRVQFEKKLSKAK